MACVLDSMNIRRIQPSELAATFELLASNGWRERLGSVDRFARLVDASQVADVAVAEDHVVGFVRAITDGLSNGYLSMLVVAPGQRRKGIGRALVAHALAANPDGTWVLRVGRTGAADFFAKVGFRHSAVAMERPRV